MSKVGQREFQTQRRVVAFFRDALDYRYLGRWQDRPDNRNVEKELVADWLKRQGHSDKIIDKSLFELNKAAVLGGSKTLYDANREVYGLLSYGVKVRPDVGEQNVTVWLIDWENPSNNDFAIAEEVTVRGQNTKRPDLVLYVNGIALGVLGVKKICCHNQYFGVKAAQARVKRREGGIIWHTQGSGKSLTMVWLAKWIATDWRARGRGG